jgi:hypothetical protein
MDRALRLCTCLAFAAAALAFAQPASAGIRTLSATASFDSGATSVVDPTNPCIVTSVQVTVRESNGPEHASFVIVDVNEYDTCVPPDDFGGVAEFYTVQPLSGGEFVMSPNLRQARLTTDVLACELADESFCLSLHLDLHWDGTGEVSEEGAVTQRSATASGTISDGSRELAPEPTWYATLSAEG